jgi:hypothetical protein
MRHLKHGVLDSIINEFIERSYAMAYVEVEDVKPSYLKTQLSRKIKQRDLTLKVVFNGAVVELADETKSWIESESGKITVKGIPLIRRTK